MCLSVKVFNNFYDFQFKETAECISQLKLYDGYMEIHYTILSSLVHVLKFW